MELEKRIAKIERLSVRVFCLIMLIIAFLAVLTYVTIELVKFVSHQWMSWQAVLLAKPLECKTGTRVTILDPFCGTGGFIVENVAGLT